jgi:hypothetical protein
MTTLKEAIFLIDMESFCQIKHHMTSVIPRETSTLLQVIKNHKRRKQ